MKKLKLKEILEGIEDNRRKNSVMYTNLYIKSSTY